MDTPALSLMSLASQSAVSCCRGTVHLRAVGNQSLWLMLGRWAVHGEQPLSCCAFQIHAPLHTLCHSAVRPVFLQMASWIWLQNGSYSHALLRMTYMTRRGYLVVVLFRAGHSILENVLFQQKFKKSVIGMLYTLF